MTDSRFDTSKWSAEDIKHDPSSIAGPSSASSHCHSRSSSPSQADRPDDNDDDDDHPPEDGPIVKPLTAGELEAFQRKQKKKGIIYISRIPPGMTPPKVRHLLSGYGEVERIYLQDGRRKEREAEAGKKLARRHTSFTEGWVEFAKKSVARVVAESLNAQPIGFTSGGRSSNKNAKRWKDDVWTLKYLPGFKWHMLSEQMAHERAAHASRLRTELSQSKFEQQDYLKKVERARVQRDKEERRRQRAAKAAGSGKQTSEPDPAATGVGSVVGPGGKARTFKQRQPVVRDVRDQREAGPGGSKKRLASDMRDADEGSLKKSRAGGQSALEGVLSKLL